VPYNGLEIAELRPDAVIVERAERHLSYLAETAPIVPSPQVDVTTDGATANPEAEARSTVTRSENGPLTAIAGLLDPALVDLDTAVYVSVAAPGDTPRVYEAFTLSPAETGADNGYLAYLPTSALPPLGTVTVYAGSPGHLTHAATLAL